MLLLCGLQFSGMLLPQLPHLLQVLLPERLQLLVVMLLQLHT